MTCESCERLLKENESLRKRIEVLERLLNVYDNPNTPPSQKKTGRKENRGNGKPGRKEGHTGTTRPYREPDRTIVAKARECPQCGHSGLNHLGFIRRLIDDIPDPRPFLTTEFLNELCNCDNCGKEFVASHPDCPEEGRMGKNVIALSTLLKHKGRLTYRNISDMLEIQYGIKISPSTIMDMTGRAADALRPEYEEIRSRIPLSKKVNVDETSSPVNGKNNWFWGFVGDDKDVLYVIDKSRGKSVPESVLDGFNGILITDGWKSYNKIPCVKQRCWAHILREAKDLARKEREAEGIYTALKILFETTGNKLSNDPPPWERLSIHNNALEWMDRWLSFDYKYGKVRKFVNKVRNGRNEWFTFVLNPGIEPTNNAAERGVREFGVQRKIFGTLRNRKGTYRYETLMTVMETWKRHGLNVYEEIRNRL